MECKKSDKRYISLIIFNLLKYDSGKRRAIRVQQELARIQRAIDEQPELDVFDEYENNLERGIGML